MKSLLLGGIALATTLIIQCAPATAQSAYGAGRTHVGHGSAGHGYARHGYASHGRGGFQNRHGGYAHGYRPGYGVGAGVAAVAAGALIGGAIASQNQGYYPAEAYPVYSDPGYGYGDAAPAVYAGGGSVAYCEQTFRSYDPSSGTYLGYDGIRHPCP